MRWSTLEPRSRPASGRSQVAAIAAWIRRLRADHDEGRGGLAVHRSSDPGPLDHHLPVGRGRASAAADRGRHRPGRARCPVGPDRATCGAARPGCWRAGPSASTTAGTSPPEWVRDADRRVPIVSISGTNGKSTVTRLISHILLRAGPPGRDDDLGRRARRRADGRAWGLDRSRRGAPDPRPQRHRGRGARDGPRRAGPARRGLRVERGERADQRLVRPPRPAGHPHPARAGRGQVARSAGSRSPTAGSCSTRTIRWSRPSLGGSRPMSRCSRSRATDSAVVRRHRERGGRAYLVRDGSLIEANGDKETRIVEVARVPITIGGLARHNVANALAAAGGARGVGATIAQVRDGLIDFAPSAERSPGRLNLFRLGARVVIVDFAHNEAGVGGRPRCRPGDRRWRGRASGPDHGHHRDGRRSAGRHAARDRPDRRRAGPAGRDQADPDATCAAGRPNRSSARS